MVGGCTPVSVRCSWKARSSSGVAVSGERPRKVASLLTAPMYSRCVSGTNLRMLMSSSMRWRSGLMGFSLIGGSCLEVGVLDPSILKTERPPVTRARSNGYCGRRNTPDRPASPVPRERVRSLAPNGHGDPLERCPLLGPKRKTSPRSEYFTFCEGFRMTAHWDDAACTEAVVRKPPVKERAGGWVGGVLRAMEI